MILFFIVTKYATELYDKYINEADCELNIKF